MANSYYSIIEPIIYTASKLEAISNRYLFRPIGMNVSSVKLLGLLCKRKIMAPKEIMELIGGTKSNISQRLDFLEKKGYIKTHKNTSSDKRKLSVKLTPSGKRKLGELKKHLEKVKLELESNFNKHEIAQHFAFFNKLNNIINSKEKDFPKCKIFCK
jgi:DNA-binding MarR family transcriptional regulator